MKYVLPLAVATTLTASSLFANEIGATGISWGIETTTEYNTESEVLTLTTTPELNYTMWNLDLTASSDIAIYNEEFVLGDKNPTLDFEISKMMMEQVEIYAKTGYDLEKDEMNDIIVGATFSF